MFGFESITDLFDSATARVVVVAVAVLVVFLFSGVFNRERKFSTLTLTFSAMCIAIATILSFVKPYEMPQGGSPTVCSMFFVTIIGYWFGPSVGLTSAVAYGLIQLAIKPSVYYPMQLVFDYILAFGALGLSGYFRKGKFSLYIGYAVGCISRFIFSSISGYIFFAEYAPAGQNALIYTLSYNASYIIPEMILTYIIILIPAVRAALYHIGKKAKTA